MTFQNKNFNPSRQSIHRDQIITTEDLFAFKQDLLDEIKSIVKELHDQGGKKWLRSRDVRKVLGISPGTLQNLRINGALPFTKVGGVIFYNWQDIDRMIESNRIDNAL